MSFLNDLLGGQGQQAGSGSLIGVAGQLIEKAGGVQGLISMLQQHGLGGAVQSWVGTGTNQPVSGDQLQNALGSDTIASIASKLGINAQTLLPMLATMLPALIDQLTPHGKVPDQGLGNHDDLLGSLSGLLQGKQS